MRRANTEAENHFMTHHRFSSDILEVAHLHGQLPMPGAPGYYPALQQLKEKIGAFFAGRDASSGSSPQIKTSTASPEKEDGEEPEMSDGEEED